MTAFFRAGQCSGDAVVEALVACGFPLTTSRWTVFRGLLICTIPGAAIGIAAGYAVFGLSYRTIGNIFAQYWEWQPSATSLLSIFFCRSDFAVLAMLDMVGFVLPHVL